MRHWKPLLLIPVLALFGCPAAEKTPTPAPKAPISMSRAPAPKALPGEATPKEASAEPSEPAQAKAAAGAVAINPDNTKIEFVGTKTKGKHVGGFKTFTGGIELSDKAVSKISVDIDTSSLFADNPKLTGHLMSPDFFDVATHPKAAFASTDVKTGTGKDAIIEGDLTLHGVKKAISFPAKIETTADSVSIASEFTIKQSDFGMGYKGVDDVVTIKIAAKAPRK